MTMGTQCTANGLKKHKFCSEYCLSKIERILVTCRFENHEEHWGSELKPKICGIEDNSGFTMRDRESETVESLVA